jgi:CRISPR/Cas system-associated endonuclease Cas1
VGRTLYLGEHRGMKVTRDGPSLWIRIPGQAGHRVPVRLIERVVIVGRVEIDSSVLTLFAKHDIPVFLFNNRGEEMAVAVSLEHKRPKYFHRQRIFLASGENKERYMNLLRSWRRRLQLYVIKRISKKRLVERFAVQGLKEHEYKGLVNSVARRYGNRFNCVHRVVKGLFKEMVISRIQKAGLDPDLGVLYKGRRFGLVLDLCYVLEPEQDLQTFMMMKSIYLNRFVNHQGVTSEGMRDIVLRFENRLAFSTIITDRIIRNIIEAMYELETEGCITIIERKLL